MQAEAHEMLVTMVTAISAGILLIAVGRRLGVPSIVLLLGGGFALGPEGIGLVQPDSLGEGLQVIVPLMVGLILFEGGLTLDLDGFRLARGMIRRLLSVGVLTTWLGAAAAIWLVTSRPIAFSLIAASLVIVTGPTVITPLLKRIRVTERLHHILHWEGVLIDPIGVFVAILCFEALALGVGGEALVDFGLRLGTGLLFGAAGGWLIYEALRRRLVPDDMLNIAVVGFAVLVFGATEAVVAEGGLLSVTVAGFVLGWKRPVELEAIRHFKAELIELCIGLLFILLTARLSVDQFAAFGWRGVLLVALVMVVVRPLTVLASSLGTDVSWRERAFLSWCAPRGIVAASMASLFAINLEAQGVPDPRFVESFAYGVIVGTIVLQGLSAGWLARVLGLMRGAPRGWLIVGAHPLGRAFADYLRRAGVEPVLLVDTNPRSVAEARGEGISAEHADARNLEGLEDRELTIDLANLLALTDNEDLNVVLCQRWSKVLGPAHVFRWRSGPEPADVAGAGRPVWTDLPRPSALSAELAHGEARFVEPGGAPGHPRHSLALEEGGAVTLDGQASGQPELEIAPGALVLEREAELLAGGVRQRLVWRIGPAFDGPVPLLAHLVERLGEVLPDLDGEALIETLVARERAIPSALGLGLAVPHAYVPSLEQPVCVIARLEHGVAWEAPDGEPVRLVFMVLSPDDDREVHLATLAQLARLLGTEGLPERLLAAPPDEAVELVRARCRG